MNKGQETAPQKGCAARIHPTAIVSENAEIAEDVVIGPYCVIGDRVSLKAGVVLHSHVVIEGTICTIGESTEVFPFVSINQPQDKKFSGEPSEVIIGRHNKLREYVTIHPGTAGDRMQTTVGDHNLFMVGVHVAHDCCVGNHVVMANNATLAGHVTIGDHVLLGGLSAIHQFVTIGDYTVIGGMSGVEHDVLPYGNVRGDRAFLNGLNIVGLRRNGFTNQQIDHIKQVYNLLFDEDNGTLAARIEKISQMHSGNEAIERVLKFVARDNLRSLLSPR